LRFQPILSQVVASLELDDAQVGSVSVLIQTGKWSIRYGGKNRSARLRQPPYPRGRLSNSFHSLYRQLKRRKGIGMSKEEDNKAVVGRWFTEFWGKNCNLAVVDAIAAPDMLLK
jgi:hypothetical protein